MRRYSMLALAVAALAFAWPLIESLNKYPYPICYPPAALAWSLGLLLGALLAIAILPEDKT